MNAIGTLNEKSLHSDLKSWCLRPGDRTEVPVGAYIVDIQRGDLLIEIQTRNFSSIRNKLRNLTAHHPVRLIYPVAEQRWIVKLPSDESEEPTRRKSPKRGSVLQIFEELVSIPDLLAHSNFSVQVVSIHEEELRRFDAQRAWRRRGWVTQERRLLQVREDILLQHPADMAALLPADLPASFTTADLKHALTVSRRLAQQMAYCLRKMKLITRVGKRGNAILYERASSVRFT